MSSGAVFLPDLWAKTVDLAKDRVNNRSFWEALEQAVPITVEDDTLVVGLNARQFNLAGHLTSADHKNAVEKVASQVAGRRLSLRVIEGDTLDDWNTTKKREARVATLRDATYERRDKEDAASQSWEALNDYIARAYSSMQLRSLPQVKARYLTDMLYVIADAMDQLYPEQPDETTERHLARTLEKVANATEVPATQIALEVERLRAWRRQSPLSRLEEVQEACQSGGTSDER